MFRDTSMDYLSRDEVLEIWNNNMRLTDEQLLAMDETEFRARVREGSDGRLCFLRCCLSLQSPDQ